MELQEKLAHLGGLYHAVGYSVILDLFIRARDDGLSLSSLGDKVGTQEYG
jgi:hypothetical protein